MKRVECLEGNVMQLEAYVAVSQTVRERLKIEIDHQQQHIRRPCIIVNDLQKPAQNTTRGDITASTINLINKETCRKKNLPEY